MLIGRYVLSYYPHKVRLLILLDKNFLKELKEKAMP